MMEPFTLCLMRYAHTVILTLQWHVHVELYLKPFLLIEIKNGIILGEPR